MSILPALSWQRTCYAATCCVYMLCAQPVQCSVAVVAEILLKSHLENQTSTLLLAIDIASSQGAALLVSTGSRWIPSIPLHLPPTSPVKHMTRDMENGDPVVLRNV